MLAEHGQVEVDLESELNNISGICIRYYNCYIIRALKLLAGIVTIGFHLHVKRNSTRTEIETYPA